MDYEPTNEQRNLQQNMSRFCREEVVPNARVLDESPRDMIGSIMKDNLKRLSKVNYMGLGIEARYGGEGLDLVSQCIAGEELAKACASTFISAWSSACMVGAMLEMFGTSEQKEKYLPMLSKADKIGAIAYTESDAGVDIAAIKTAAIRRGDRWVINGGKDLITNAPIADVFLVLAYTDVDTGYRSGATVFIIDKGMHGLKVGSPIDTMGLRGAPIASITMNDCEVPIANVLGGEPGKGFEHMERILDIGKFGMAVMSVGIGMACMEIATQYAQTRKTFGEPIGRFQEVSFKLAEMLTYNDLGRMLTHRAAWGVDKGDEEATILASCAKLFTSEAVANTVHSALQIFGGRGYLKGADVERLYRDARFCEIGYGTSEILRSVIAKNTLTKFES